MQGTVEDHASPLQEAPATGAGATLAPRQVEGNSRSCCTPCASQRPPPAACTPSCGQGPAAERDPKQGVFPEQRPIHKTRPFFRKFSLSTSAVRCASFLPDLQAAVEGAT